MKKRAKLALFVAPLAFLFSPLVAYADSIFNGVYEQTTVYVGNEWTATGSYDDSLPEENSGDTYGIYTYDSYDDTKYISSFELQGTIGSSTINVTLWNQPTDSSGAATAAPTQVGTMTVHSAQMGQQLSVSVSNANAISFGISAVGGPGQVYLSNLWGVAFDLTGTPSTVQGNVSAGEIAFAQPTWWNSYFATTGTTGTSTPSTVISTSGPTTINVYGWPSPPDWPVIEQGIANDIINDIPPVPAPPSGSSAITQSTGLSVQSPGSPPAIATPAITGVPQDPIIAATSYNFSDSADESAISVPTSGSQPFSIGDPLSGLSYTSGYPIPGSSPFSPYQPATSGAGVALPVLSPPALATSGYPVYQGSTSLLGTMVTPSLYSGSGSGPAPAPPASGTSLAPAPTITASSAPSPSLYSGSVTGPSYTY